MHIDVEKPERLLGMVAEMEGREALRFSNHRESMKLWRLERYVLEEVFHFARTKMNAIPSVTSNEPRTYSNAVMAFAAFPDRAPVNWRFNVPPTSSSEEEDTASANERFIMGALQEVDFYRLRRGDMHLQHDMAWLIAHRGGVILRTIFDWERFSPYQVDLWDPLECVWESDADGIGFICRHYFATKSDVESRYGEEVKASEYNLVNVYDTWWRDGGEVYNGVIAAGQASWPFHIGGRRKWLREPTPLKEFKGELPIGIVRMGGAPVGPDFSGDRRAHIADQWVDIYSSNKELYARLNRILSLFDMFTAKMVLGPYIYAGRENKEIELGLERPFSVVTIAPGETFGPSLPPALAGEIREIYAAVQGMIQRGSVPSSTFGQLPFELSGYAISNLRQGLDIAVGGILYGMARAHEFIGDLLSRQFMNQRRTARVKGFDTRNRFFEEELRPRDLSKKYNLQVRIRPRYAADMLSEANAATALHNAGLDLRTIMDQYLNIADPQAVQGRRAEEDMARDPVFRYLRYAYLLGKRPDPESQEMARMMRELAMRQLEQATGGGQGTAQPGAQFPQSLPPEAAGIRSRYQPSSVRDEISERLQALGLERRPS